MKRYIFEIQYNKTDKEVDPVYIDAESRERAKQKLRKQFPGVYNIKFIRIEKEL